MTKPKFAELLTEHMTKSLFAEFLTKNGYPAENDGGVVVIKSPLSAEDLKEIKKLIKEVGYNASYGYILRA